MDFEYVLLLAVFLLIVVSVWMAKDKKELTTNKKTKKQIDSTEDTPVPFGYKCVWFAVKSNSHTDVAEAIDFKDKIVSNWESGIREAYEDSVFLTPPIDGWVLVIGWGLPPGDSTESIEEIKLLANKLSMKFGETQFFGTHRVVEYHCWLKSVNGEIVRLYSYFGELNENIEIVGEETEFERNYNLINTFSEEAQHKSYWKREDITYPDEELVMKIAEKWSINPTTLDNHSNIKGTGLLGIYK